MVMRADVLARAIDAVSPPGDPRPRLLMSPRGKPLTQARVRELAADPAPSSCADASKASTSASIDSRGLEEVSIGDFILSGGEPAAIVLLDAVVRLLPGVMGNALSGDDESFEKGLLEHPHYTRPQEFEGETIPEVLISGNHAKIAAVAARSSGKIDRRAAAGSDYQSASAGHEIIAARNSPTAMTKPRTAFCGTRLAVHTPK